MNGLEGCYCERTCSVKGVIYREDEGWTDGCRNCTCSVGFRARGGPSCQPPHSLFMDSLWLVLGRKKSASHYVCSNAALQPDCLRSCICCYRGPESFCSSLPFIQRRCVWVCVGVVAALILIICHKEAGSPQVAVRKTSGSHALTCGCGRTVDSSGGSRARSRSRRQTRRPLSNRSHLPMGRLHAPLLDMQSKQGNHSSQRTAPNCS